MNPHQLNLSRTFRSSPQQLWRAWTTVDGLAGWWWNTWPDTSYHTDPVVGGEYRIEAAAHGIAVHGTYLELTPFTRLVFSWIRVDDGVDGDIEQVTVTFAADGNQTRLDLVHTGPWTDGEPAESYRQGWDFVLGALQSMKA